MAEFEWDFYKVMFEDLDPKKLRLRFLSLLLKIQNVERGSIWVKERNRYLCVESMDGQCQPGDINGASISTSESSIVGWVIKNGKMTVADPSKDHRHFQAFEDGMNIRSTRIVCFPLILRTGVVYGAIQLIDTKPQGNRMILDKKYLELLKAIVDMGSIALSNALDHARQVERNEELEHTLEKIRGDVQIIGQSQPFLEVMKSVREYARTNFPVLITGESGTGKDLVATALHNLSARKDKPFLVQNCSAIPGSLLESELFGYKKGAFTGATEDKTGLLGNAEGGTVFLDEIGDMSLQLQARVLRVIQNNEIKPLGESRTKKINVRFICATNKDLKEAIEKRQFREDLFYRINVLPLHMPPLRERKKDIPLLLKFFLKREADKLGIPVKRISPKVLHSLVEYPWGGNIRELENFVKYILSTVDGVSIGRADIPNHLTEKGFEKKEKTNRLHFPENVSASHQISSQSTPQDPFAGYGWQELEHAYVIYLLEKNKWNVTRAAQDAKVNRSTFDSRMKKLGISKK